MRNFKTVNIKNWILIFSIVYQNFRGVWVIKESQFYHRFITDSLVVMICNTVIKLYFKDHYMMSFLDETLILTSSWCIFWRHCFSTSPDTIIFIRMTHFISLFRIQSYMSSPDSILNYAIPPLYCNMDSCISLISCLPDEY